MKNFRPIFWQQGLFLQPQHFQLSDLYHQSLLVPLTKFANPYLWGVSKIKIDTDALKELSFVINEARLVFPDGTYMEFPGNAIAQSRSFEDTWVEGRGSLKVYLGIRKWDLLSENVTVVANLDDVANVTTRYATTANPEEVPDLYYNGPPAQVKRLNLIPKIFWETEKDQLANFYLIPIAQLEQDGEEIRLSDNFIPPSLQVDSYPVLQGIIKEIHDKVSSRCRRLEEYKSPRGMQSSELEPGVFFLLMGLRAITKYVPWLTHIVEFHNAHPLHVYEKLIEFVGELTIFSSNISATGETQEGSNVIPAYDHHDLYKCFSTLSDLIGVLLDEITFGPESIIRLNWQDPYYVGEMDTGVFSDRNVYYLSLRTESDQQSVKDSIQTVAKLSAGENLPILISRALPGLGLEHILIPPPGLPQISSTVYFRVEISSTQWDDVQRLNNIALHWDNAPEDLIAEIIVLRRN